MTGSGLLCASPDLEQPTAIEMQSAANGRTNPLAREGMTTLLPSVARKATGGYGLPSMSLSHLWPSFPLERILYEDADLIVIDKPESVSTHAPDAGRTDDAVSRLKGALAERDRVPVDRIYLGIHQRLDRDTSGALLFTRQKGAN